MKITRLKKQEIVELTPELHQQELRSMEGKGKITISFEPNAAEKKLAEKKKRPFVVRTVETLVIE